MNGHNRTDTTASARGRRIRQRHERSLAARPLGTTTVLIAEPQRLYAEALMIALDASPELEPIGYALDGWEALELAGSFEPDAIIVGAGLGGLDMVTFTRIAHLFWPRIRLILLADTQVPIEVEEAYAVGAADYLPKSRSADELLTAIERACLRRATFEGTSSRAVGSLPRPRGGGLDG